MFSCLITLGHSALLVWHLGSCCWLVFGIESSVLRSSIHWFRRICTYFLQFFEYCIGFLSSVCFAVVIAAWSFIGFVFGWFWRHIEFIFFWLFCWFVCMWSLFAFDLFLLRSVFFWLWLHRSVGAFSRLTSKRSLTGLHPIFIFVHLIQWWCWLLLRSCWFLYLSRVLLSRFGFSVRACPFNWFV